MRQRLFGRHLATGLALLMMGGLTARCGDDDGADVVSSRAYKGHENDQDINYFVNVYPATVGTRLDDCQTCHTGGTFTYNSSSGVRSVVLNACDFCHMIANPHDPGYNEAQPTTYAETLNPYGADYLAAGRDKAALREIEDDDSDGDTYSNVDEIDALRYPGDPSSMPGQEMAPMQVFTMADLEAMDQHTEFLLANSHKQEFDNYAQYRGVRIIDLLEEAGVDVHHADFAGITVIAPDGYMKDFSAEDVRNQFPDSQYYAGLDTATLGTECGYVTYPDVLPTASIDGTLILDEQWLVLGLERDGLPMDPSNLDITSGKINGEGPYRIIVPQSEPNLPDRGSSYSPTTCADDHDYNDLFDHNAGAMVRGVIAIRVNPLPAGYEDFDAHNGGWAFIEAQEVLVYGFGVTAQ